jgi:hypothetical protein
VTAGSEGVPEAGVPLAGSREPSRGVAACPAAGPHDVDSADHLRALGAGLAATLAEPGGPALARAAADALVPIDAAARLGLVADEPSRTRSGTPSRAAEVAGWTSCSRPTPTRGGSWWRTAASACRAGTAVAAAPA